MRSSSTLADRFAALAFEEMQAARIERHAHRIVRRELDLRIDARGDQGTARGAHAEQELGAELLGHFDDGVERRAVLGLLLTEPGVLRPHTEQHRTVARAIAQRGAIGWHPDAKAGPGGVKLAA